MISAATACVDDSGIFCFQNCNTSNVTQFCNCVVNQVVAENDTESLNNATLVEEFENQTASILQTSLGYVWCCTFIIIRQYVPPGNNVTYITCNMYISLLSLPCLNPSGYVYILQLHCTKVNAASWSVEITKFWSYTRLLVPFSKEIICANIFHLLPRVNYSKSVQLPYGFYTWHLDRMTQQSAVIQQWSHSRC